MRAMVMSSSETGSEDDSRAAAPGRKWLYLALVLALIGSILATIALVGIWNANKPLREDDVHFEVTMSNFMQSQGQQLLDLEDPAERSMAMVQLEETVEKISVVDAMVAGVLTTSADWSKLRNAPIGEDVGCKRDKSLCHQGDMLAVSSSNLNQIKNLAGRRLAAENLWEDGVMYYCFASDLPASLVRIWDLAIADYEKAVPCLKFINVGNSNGYSSATPDTEKACNSKPAVFVQVDAQEGCWSFVGRLNPPIYSGRGVLNANLLNLGEGCDFYGVVVHEIGHALGLYHEQNRMNRDDYVQIHWQNMDLKYAPNFNKSKEAYSGQIKYDFISVMHYGTTDFSSRGLHTMTPVNASLYAAGMGQRVGLSQRDAERIAEIYKAVKPACVSAMLTEKLGCQERNETRSSCESLMYCNQFRSPDCCACGGGVIYKCEEGSLCYKPTPLPIRRSGSVNRRMLVSISIIAMLTMVG